MLSRWLAGGLRGLRPSKIRLQPSMSPWTRHAVTLELCENTVIHVTEPSDPRVALYMQRRRRTPGDEAVCAEKERALIERAENHNCVVGLHFSLECLRRLAEARARSRDIIVDSVMLPSNARDALVQAAFAVSPTVYSVDPSLHDAEFQSKGAGKAAKTCSFVVAYPASQCLSALRPPLLVLDGLASPRNVGEILRSAMHLGVTSVVASKSAWSCLNGRAARSSMGWLYHMDFHLALHLPSALQELRDRGVFIYTGESDAQMPVAAHVPTGDRFWALVVGNEETGVSNASRALSDAHVCVPQRGGESLNVSHAAAICLYALGRDMDV